MLVGVELVKAVSYSYNYNELWRETALRENHEKAVTTARALAEKFGCDYFMLGDNPIRSGEDVYPDMAHIYVVSLFSRR